MRANGNDPTRAKLGPALAAEELHQNNINSTIPRSSTVRAPLAVPLILSLSFTHLCFPKMTVERLSWQARAAAKVADTHSKIGDHWLLDPKDIERAKQQRQLSGTFMEGFLTEDELDIVRTDSVPLVESLKTGKRSAVQVTRAFCKAAAVAHQIVLGQSCS